MVAELQAETREGRGKERAKKMRANGLVPAVVYGHGQPAASITIERRLLDRMLASGEQLVSLKLSGGDRQAIIKEVQLHTISQAVLHVDFQEVRMDEAVTVTVSVRLRGTAAGAKDGGVVDHELHEVSVTCLPANIPEEIVVDVSGLDVGDSLRVQDLTLPEKVTVEADPEAMVALCRMPIEEAEPEPEEVAEGPAAPEVITERKEEEAGEEAEAT